MIICGVEVSLRSFQLPETGYPKKCWLSFDNFCAICISLLWNWRTSLHFCDDVFIAHCQFASNLRVADSQLSSFNKLPSAFITWFSSFGTYRLCFISKTCFAQNTWMTGEQVVLIQNIAKCRFCAVVFACLFKISRFVMKELKLCLRATFVELRHFLWHRVQLAIDKTSNSNCCAARFFSIVVELTFKLQHKCYCHRHFTLSNCDHLSGSNVLYKFSAFDVFFFAILESFSEKSLLTLLANFCSVLFRSR